MLGQGFNLPVRTTGLAGGLLCPYRGLLLAKLKGLLIKIPLLQNLLRPLRVIYFYDNLCFFQLPLINFSCYNLFAHMSQNSFIQNVVGEPTFL